MIFDKEKIIVVKFNKQPIARVRTLNGSDHNLIICSKDGEMRSLWDDKKTFPYKLDNEVILQVQTSKRYFEVNIFKNYTWNGSDIPRFIWSLVGSQYDPEYLSASLAHDFLLEMKYAILKEVFQEQITISEYRRLTSLIFREIIKNNGTKTIKSNLMSWCVDIFQATINRSAWK